jgi:hypothetical protein
MPGVVGRDRDDVARAGRQDCLRREDRVSSRAEPRPVRQPVFIDNPHKMVEGLSLFGVVSDFLDGVERGRGECVRLTDLILREADGLVAIVERWWRKPQSRGPLP